MLYRDVFMSTKDDPLELYQAFHIGLMIAAALRGEEFTVEQHLKPALEILRSVAAKDSTLHDPQEEAAKNPEIAAFTAHHASLVFEVHRKMAAKILRSKESQVQVREIKP
jgi:hypothetical protein